MSSGQHVVRLLKPKVNYILLALAATVYAPVGIAYDVKEYEGNTMAFEITKPTTSDGYNYPEKVRYSYSVKDGSAKNGSDYNVPDGKTGKIVFPEGSATTAKINIKLFEDDLDEGNGETLKVVLTSPQYEVTNGMYLYGFYLPTHLSFDGLILDPD